MDESDDQSSQEWDEFLHMQADIGDYYLRKLSSIARLNMLLREKSKPLSATSNWVFHRLPLQPPT
jgi:hypothetical protein